ncbi:MAG TPA: iron-siderophore ABC transporter substrate-binding protein, partial [Solirubrobacteraceae bacterium]|nr:iron-siderophore ABC transporter substrate-binding protein [Solirubrobacteraceae bacterium]
SAPAGAGFPVTIEHKFGETTVREAPERVVAVGFNDQDFALALGVTPVGVRQFQAGIDIMGRPWAQDELAGAEPQVVGAEELELEKIAALRPDLILGVYSGLTDKEYGTLSKIAPTIAQSDEYPDFGQPWQEQAEVSSRAMGLEQEGDEVVDDVEQQFARAREAYPELEGGTFAFAAASTGRVFAYGAEDLRTRFFLSLGLELPRELDALTGKSFYAELSEERLRLLDQDVLVIYGSPKDLEAFPLFERMRAVREGRVIFLDPDSDLANALGFSSPLSLPYALDRLVPRLSRMFSSH